MSEEAGHGTVHVDYHKFWLSERVGPTPTPGACPANGLVAPQIGAVEVWAGTHTGSVPVTVEVRDDAPTDDDFMAERFAANPNDSRAAPRRPSVDWGTLAT